MDFDTARSLILVTFANHQHKIQAILEYGRFADDLLLSVVPGLFSLLS